MTSDALQEIVRDLPTANGLLEYQRLVGANVHLSRSSEGKIQIILSDSEPPTRPFSLRRARLESGIDFDSEEYGDLERCVVLEFDHGVDNAAVVKVAEHLCGDFSSDRSGDDLGESVQAFQSLLENPTGSVWGFTRIVGLWGELACLERLLLLCSNDQERLACVRAWKSTGIHCMDFVFNPGGAAFDVKTTSMIVREHTVTSVDQVSSGPFRETGLLSIMIRPVAEGEGLSVTELVSRIERSLDGEPLDEFRSRVRSLSLDDEECNRHRFRERAGRPMRLFPQDQVPGVTRFLPLPEGVPELSWAVQMPEGGMQGADLDGSLHGWVSSHAEAMADE